MTISNPQIQALSTSIDNEKKKADTPLAPFIADIRDYCEVAQVNGLPIRNNVPGVFYIGSGTSFIVNGRTTLLANIPVVLANESMADLLSMRDALARALNEALASLKQQKGSAP